MTQFPYSQAHLVLICT